MSDLNTKHNRAVWIDIPVADLGRAREFYAAVLDINVAREKFGDVEFCVLEHDSGNGGCLVVDADAISSERGILVYLNANGRIKDAVAKVETHGGKIIEPVQSIGPHGFRALIVDSEGNRVALHSNTDT